MLHRSRGAAGHVLPGRTQVCAIDNNSATWCWGQNDEGQHGDGTTTSNPVPVAVGRNLRGSSEPLTMPEPIRCVPGFIPGTGDTPPTPRSEGRRPVAAGSLSPAINPLP